ncbi:hypothetical protein [Actinomyces dentalis]|uniref:hypothetical protein n=1 Tax=Actinomyces dentalis TaxID=272548 RepID=UPI0004192D14|nr:hypothetical protein [Actinomyces dentalis]
MPLSRWAQRSARVVALGAAALGLGPRTRPPAPVPLAAAPAAGEGADAAALALRATAAAAADLINVTTAVTATTDVVGRLTAEGARPADPGRGAADPSPAAPRP